MAQLRPKIVKLAKIIGGVTGIATKIDENAPEYYCMAGILSDDEADIAIAAGLRKERTAGYLAKKVGKTVEEIAPLLDNLVYYGIFRRSMDKALGEDVYYMQIFAPGILEMMVNQKELLETHPEVGRAFDEYTRNLAASMGAMIPDGYGLMRVIPVESALEGIEGVSDYERISHYLDKYDRFSVSPCSCRASRSSLGDGCGHLEEDMCVQMGRGAEHYIRTGRAREITREQALEIIQRAEENGLMHDMVNIEEPGESAAICNCCACACFGLRVGLMFGARDAIRSNYVAEVDEAKCVACGQCVETCPGNALKLGQKLCSTEDLTPQPDYVKLSETIHPKRSWNPDYREDHEDVMPTGTAPCKTACPAHVPVQGYLKLAAQGRYTDALELIKKENPFPAVCGRICNKRCETECTRGAVDEAVAIDEVKRFIADHDLHEATRFVPKLCNQIGRPYTEKIAVIGAGPAGMSCAYYLANKGYPVTVFDRNPVPGGMLTLGIPNFRLEKDVLNAEIDILRKMGVEFRCGVEVGRDITIEQLREAPEGIFVERPEEERKMGAPVYRNYEKLFAQLPGGKVQCYNEWIGGKPNNTETGELGYLPVYQGPPEGIAETPDIAAEYPYIISDVHAYRLCNHSYYVGLPYLRELQPYPWCKINPQTAKKHGINDGDWMKIESPHGWIKLRAEYFEGISPEVLMCRRGWWQSCEELGLPGYGGFDGGSDSSVLYDTTIENFDPFHSAMAKQTLVKISKIEEGE